MTYPLPGNSLLDRGDLPFSELAKIGCREGRRGRPVYGAHKWFARRLGTSIRALLVAAATESREQFWNAYYQEGLLEGVTVLDPFVGGGSILMEAARLGADGFGCDIDPVAAAVSKFQASDLWALPDLRLALQRLQDTVGRLLAPYYRTVEPDGTPGILLHAFWVHVATCGNCSNLFDAHPDFRLAWDKNVGRQHVVCKCCGKVEEHVSAEEVTCSDCGVVTAISAGNAKDGNPVCPFCGAEESMTEMCRRLGSPPAFRIFAVETLPVAEEIRLTNRQRVIREATPEDLATYEAASEEFRRRCELNPHFVANAPIPVERSDHRPLSYGYSTYGELYNNRQKLHLGLLAQAIQRLNGSERNALQIAFSNHLKTNCMMAAYAGGWRRLTPIFSIRAFRHVARPVELNPWLTYNGRGTFPNAVRSVEKAAAWLQNQQEHSVDGGFREVQTPRQGNIRVQLGDAKHLKGVPNNSIDLVVTDPPYVDYISYSELAHFFTPWMRRFQLVPPVAVKGFPKNQLAPKSRTQESLKKFEKQIRQVFAEIRRVVKEDGRVVLSYQFSGEDGWLFLGKALAEAGVIPSVVFPILGDSDAGLHKSPETPRWDGILVCRPELPMTDITFDDEDKIEAANALRQWQEWNPQVELNAADRLNFFHALTLKAACHRLRNKVTTYNTTQKS